MGPYLTNLPFQFILSPQTVIYIVPRLVHPESTDHPPARTNPSGVNRLLSSPWTRLTFDPDRIYQRSSPGRGLFKEESHARRRTAIRIRWTMDFLQYNFVQCCHSQHNEINSVLYSVQFTLDLLRVENNMLY